MKKLLLTLFFIIFSTQAVFAEKIPITITPAQEISTKKNEIEIGDWIRFKVVNDIYYNNKIYINKDTIVTGIVDSVHENGIVADNAEIVFKKFILRNCQNKLIEINYTLILNRENSVCYNFKDKIAKYFGALFKGNEIYIKPESTNYNIFLTK